MGKIARRGLTRRASDGGACDDQRRRGFRTQKALLDRVAGRATEFSIADTEAKNLKLVVIQRPIDHSPISTEAPDPQRMADECNLRRTAHVVLGHEVAAPGDAHAQHAQKTIGAMNGLSGQVDGMPVMRSCPGPPGTGFRKSGFATTEPDSEAPVETARASVAKSAVGGANGVGHHDQCRRGADTRIEAAQPPVDIRMSHCYGRSMRTTVRLDEGLLTKAKQEARRRGETLTSLIERGLRLAMADAGKRPRAGSVTLTVSTATGGLRPGIDLDDMQSVLDRLDGIR